MREDHHIQVSKWVVRKLLKKHGYRRRKAQKKTTMKEEIKHRDAQFENIARLKADYQAAGNPIVSMNIKKKENLGNFYRDGHLYTLETLNTYDHDFNSFAGGVIIPHSFYDVKHNVYIQLGNNRYSS